VFANKKRLKMTIEQFEIQSKDIRKALFQESLLKQPSVHSLETAGCKLLEMVKTLKSEKTHFEPKLQSLKLDLDIFLADLDGELKHDYDRGNKRYKGKWSNEKSKISGFTFRLRQYLSEDENK
jgi:hypothetical protein